jgi:hypothetical protein
MNYDNMKEILIAKFPQLKEKCTGWPEHFDYISESGPHVVYGDLLNSYVADLLRENKDIETIKKVFDFYEEMAICEDNRVRNVLQVTLLEYLWDEKTTYENALKYMGNETAKINKEIWYLTIPK